MATATKRYFPPDSRERIAEAQRKRWANKRRAYQMGVMHAVIDELQKRKREGVFWYPVPDGQQMDPESKNVIKLKDARPGMPNLGLIIDGKTHFLQIKKENGRLSQAQRERREEIEVAGGVWAVAKGLDAALLQLEDWGAINPAGQIT